MYSRLLNPGLPISTGHLVNRLFREALDAAETPVTRTPGLNIWEQGDNVIIEAELPGLSLSDVEITAHGRDVTISGTRKLAEVKDGNWLVRERGAGAFTRTVRLPYDVDHAKAQATLKDGVLTLTMPRTQAEGPRKVTITAA